MGGNCASTACDARSPFSNAPWQLEEARQVHARLEKESGCKAEEVAQVVREHRALRGRLEEESVARTRLTLELHKAEGERPEAGRLGQGCGRSRAGRGARRLWEELRRLWGRPGPPHEAAERSRPGTPSCCCSGDVVTRGGAPGVPSVTALALRPGRLELSVPRGRRGAGVSPCLVAPAPPRGWAGAATLPSCWGWARPRQRCFPVSPGIIEGFKVEKAGLQEALGQKEAAERDLVVQLESLSQQLQRAARQQAELEEENAGLWHQKEAVAAEAQAREAGRRRAGGRGPGAAEEGLQGAFPREPCPVVLVAGAPAGHPGLGLWEMALNSRARELWGWLGNREPWLTRHPLTWPRTGRGRSLSGSGRYFQVLMHLRFQHILSENYVGSATR